MSEKLKAVGRYTIVLGTVAAWGVVIGLTSHTARHWSAIHLQPIIGNWLTIMVVAAAYVVPFVLTVRAADYISLRLFPPGPVKL